MDQPLNCYTLRSGISGACHCGSPMEGACHVVSREVSVELLCRECCPVCHPLFTELAGTVETIAGETGRLF